MKKYMVFTILLGLIFMPYMALAHVFGDCSNCHTMHASQTPWPGRGDKSKLPQGYLLSTVCVSCHSSATSFTYYDLGGCKVPVVLYKGGEPSSYLAGGNFYWVSPDGEGNDAKGHNIFSGHVDQNLSEAPGAWVSCAQSCHISLATELPENLQDPTEFGSFGANGCTGCHLYPAHHADDRAYGEPGLVGKDEGWYRFLNGHMHDPNLGVEGYEHGLWEAGQPNLETGNADNHNGYLGWEGEVEWQAGFWNLGNTMTAFCCGCHGNFHKEQASGQWIRHPSDAVIPNTPGSEYADTGGGLYDPLSPVAKPTVDTPDATVIPGEDMVMCLSCHRPHGSPYPDLLRWDYTQQIAGGGGDDKGCFYCHTTKND
jgi:hypothetical protein